MKISITFIFIQGKAMSFVSAISLIITVIIMYYIIYKMYAVLFRISGITKEKSRFQAISLLTNAGFTTGESEIIVGENSRRSIAIAAMLTGYFFSVVIVSLFINLFLSMDLSQFDTQIFIIFVGFGGMFVFFLFMHIPAVQKALDKAIDGLTIRIFRRTVKENYISVLDTYGEDAVVNIYLYKVPPFLEGRRVVDSDVRKRFNVNIMMYTRNGENHYVTKDTIFSRKDRLTAFGPLASIREAFLLKDKRKEKARKSEEALNQNDILIMSNYGYQVLADIKLNRIPEIIRDKTLVESRIKDYFSINVMMVTRDGQPLMLTKDTIIEEGDQVIAFGPYESIQSVFGEKEQQVESIASVPHRA